MLHYEIKRAVIRIEGYFRRRVRILFSFTHLMFKITILSINFIHSTDVELKGETVKK